MLARYLRTSTERPVRYAMHPDLARALSNYLMIHSRAHDIPGMHHQLMPHMQGDTDLLHQLMQGMLQGHHETPGMYLDAMHEMSPQLARIPPRPYPDSDDPMENMPYYLRQMAQVMGQPQLAYGYGRTGLDDALTKRLLVSGHVGALPGQGFQPTSALDDLIRHPQTPPDLRAYLNASYRYAVGNEHHPAMLRHMMLAHDLSGEEMRRGDYMPRPADRRDNTTGGVRGHAASLNAGIREVLRDHLIPHLDELTRQMGGG